MMGEVKDLVLIDAEAIHEDEEGAADKSISDLVEEKQKDGVRWHQVALAACDDISNTALELKRQMEGLWGLAQPKASDTLKKLYTVHATLEKLIKEQV